MSKAHTCAVYLSHLGLLDITGPDSRKFAQGQVTCDVQQNTHETRLLHGAHCTHKGRMIANFDLLNLNEDTLRLRLQADTIEILQASLAKYIVFSKAKLQQPENIQLVGLIGADAYETMSGLLGESFTPDSGVHQRGNDTIMARGETRIECWLDTDSPLLQQLKPSHEKTALTQWLATDIQQGIGWVCASSTDLFTPQMLNLQTSAINGISFTKGCYTGQEIVARLHYKGKLKRHMYLFEYRNTAPTKPQVGADLYKHGSATETGKSIGHIINTAKLESPLDPDQSSDERTLLLACVTDEAVANDDVYLDPNGDHKLLQQALPYAITNEA